MGLYDTSLLSCRATAAKLATDYGLTVTPQTVARWARKAGKNRRVGGPRLPLSGRELEPLFEGGISVPELANRFQVSQSLVRERLREIGLRMRPSGTRYTSLTEDSLRWMYWSRGMSSKEIALQAGCSQFTVHYRLRLYGIPRKRVRRTR